MYMVQNPPKYDDVICEQPLTNQATETIVNGHTHSIMINWKDFSSKIDNFRLNEILNSLQLSFFEEATFTQP